MNTDSSSTPVQLYHLLTGEGPGADAPNTFDGLRGTRSGLDLRTPEERQKEPSNPPFTSAPLPIVLSASSRSLRNVPADDAKLGELIMELTNRPLAPGQALPVAAVHASLPSTDPDYDALTRYLKSGGVDTGHGPTVPLAQVPVNEHATQRLHATPVEIDEAVHTTPPSGVTKELEIVPASSVTPARNPRAEAKTKVMDAIANPPKTVELEIVPLAAIGDDPPEGKFLARIISFGIALISVGIGVAIGFNCVH